jgi:hypothetical protein
LPLVEPPVEDVDEDEDDEDDEDEVELPESDDDVVDDDVAAGSFDLLPESFESADDEESPPLSAPARLSVR